MARVRKRSVLARAAAPTPLKSAQYALPLNTTAESPSRASNVADKLWFCACLPMLPLESCPPAAGARAVVEERQGIHRVLLADTAASAAGVRPGQSANAALALLPSLELLERSTLREQQALETLAAWLERFSSFVSLAGDDRVVLEIAGSQRLYGGLRPLRQCLARGIEARGFTARFAIAPTPLAATWLAEGGRRACIRDRDNLLAALRTLPVTCLGWPPGQVESLAGMGIRSVADCLRLPREGFARRFGALRLLELDRSLGRLPDPRPSWRAPERFVAEIELTEEYADRDLLLGLCDELLARQERFLLGRQLGCRRVRLQFFHLRAAATKLTVGAANAERAAGRWQSLLALHFEKLRLPEPVVAVRLESGHGEALTTGSGRLAFGNRKRQVSAQRMRQLAERLVARIGRQSVYGVRMVAEHRPQYSWCSQDLLGAGDAATVPGGKPGAPRPMWLLPEPARLPVRQGVPVHGGPLQLLEGPERLETGWWDEAGIARDYYLATNPAGTLLWVYRNRRREAPDETGWYLHGMFG